MTKPDYNAHVFAAMPEAELQAKQRGWADALIQRDFDSLASLLDEKLVYIHATGVAQDRDGYLSFARSGPTFLLVEMRDQRWQIAGGIAVAKGVLHLTLQHQADSDPVSLTSFAVQIWHRPRDAWLLFYAQSTKPA